jgi:hypothetical protein
VAAGSRSWPAVVDSKLRKHSQKMCTGEAKL